MKQEINWERLAQQRKWCAAEMWNKAMDKLKPQSLGDVYRRMKEREQEREQSKEG